MNWVSTLFTYKRGRESADGSLGADAIVPGSPADRVGEVMSAPSVTKKITVEIRKDPTSAELRVTKRSFVWRGDQVEFVNRTGQPVDIQFPDGDLFDREDLSLATGKTETLNVGPYALAVSYPFAVYCREAKRFARGGSMPIIIVDPKR